MLKQTITSGFVPCVLIVSAIGLAAAEEQSTTTRQDGRLLCDAYPWLAQGSLTYARVVPLPDGVVLRSGDLSIRSSQIEDKIASAPQEVRAQLRSNAIYILENLATRQILISLAKANRSGQPPVKDERQLLEGFLKGLVADVKVSDEEVERFYRDNEDAIGGARLEQVKDQIRQLLVQQRQQDLIKRYVATLGKQVSVELSESWIKAQAALAKENPVDKARSSGLPSLVDFGSTTCVPCQMMAPIIEKLKSDYAGRLNVVFVNVNEQKVLASRYEIEAIPTLIFYDKHGKEVSRHVGFLPEEQVRHRLREIVSN